MTIYIAVLVMLIFFMIQKPVEITIGEKSIRSDNIYAVFTFLVLFILAALRYQIGTDYKNYEKAFETYYCQGMDPYWMNFEPGFIALNKGLAMITDDVQLLIVISSLITIFFFAKTYKDNSNDMLFSIFLFITLYFYFSSFNIIRQCIAMAIVFWGTRDILERKPVRYALKIVLASTFHTSSLIMLPFYLLAISKARIALYIFGGGISLLGMCFYDQVIDLVVKILPKYAVYLNFQTESSVFNIVFLCANLMLLILIWNMKSDMEVEVRREYDLYMHTCCCALIFYFLSPFNILFSRVAMYFFMFSTLSVPFCLDYFEEKSAIILKILAALGATAICIYYLYFGVAGVTPYEWIIK